VQYCVAHKIPNLACALWFFTACTLLTFQMLLTQLLFVASETTIFDIINSVSRGVCVNGCCAGSRAVAAFCWSGRYRVKKDRYAVWLKQIQRIGESGFAEAESGGYSDNNSGHNHEHGHGHAHGHMEDSDLVNNRGFPGGPEQSHDHGHSPGHSPGHSQGRQCCGSKKRDEPAPIGHSFIIPVDER